MTGDARTAQMRKGTAASIAMLVVFLAAWQWGPGLLGIPSFIVPPLSAETKLVLSGTGSVSVTPVAAALPTLPSFRL